MSDDVLVRVDNVSKRFCRSLKRSLWYGLQDLGSELGGRRHGGGGGLPQSSADVELRKDEFWAVKDVSFELRRGECLGLIGRNGAGKTTLLRMLNGLIKPDAGKIEMRGEVGALIALGAGFNPVLTGRENIYTNAAIMGINKGDLDDKLDEIIDFSGIGQFIDAPVQSYSSGMSVRLGFAVASSLKCKILILDEVLAVGDEEFQLKCFNRIAELIGRGDSCAILVTHQMQNIERICTRAIEMKGGQIRIDSLNTSRVVDSYEAQSTGQEPETPLITYPPSAKVKLKHIRYNPDNFTISLLLEPIDMFNIVDAKFLASYNLSSKGLNLLSGTTKGSKKEFGISNKGTVELLIPDQLARLRDVKLNLTLWDATTRKPLVWIKRIRITPTEETRGDIRLSFV
jgi:ABC-type polysaccharide/polyol phosphate transport system ATPase subunit